MATTVHLGIVLLLSVVIGVCEPARMLPGRRLDKLQRKPLQNWSSWSDALGFGTNVRTRKISRKGPSGKTVTETIRETRKSAKPPTVIESAKSFSKRFLRREGKVRDILIITDTSGSIGLKQFNYVKLFFKKMIPKLCIPVGPTYRSSTRVAAIHYSKKVVEDFDFNDYMTSASVVRELQKTSYLKSMTCTGDALKKGGTMYTPLKGHRSRYAVRDILLVTDGRSNCGLNATIESMNLRKTGINIYALALNIATVNHKEIESYVSDPPEEHVFSLSEWLDIIKFDDLFSNIENCIQFNSKPKPTPFLKLTRSPFTGRPFPRFPVRPIPRFPGRPLPRFPVRPVPRFPRFPEHRQ